MPGKNEARREKLHQRLEVEPASSVGSGQPDCLSWPVQANSLVPEIHVPRLASWVVGSGCRRLSRDWRSKYGHPVHLVETFVERERFVGTSYRAANWTQVGSTTGRTRQDRDRLIQAPVKDVYLYALHGKFREPLCA